MSKRYAWMDFARGAAILLVMLMHASAIPAILGAEYPRVLYLFGMAISPYRMPTLLVLSGMLLDRSLRKGLPTYYYGKLRLVAWPLLVWMVIQSFAGRNMWSLGDPSYWRIGGYLWFLIVLGSCYLVGPFVRLLPPWLLAFGMALAATFVTEPFTERFLYYGAFFFIGVQLGRHLSLLSAVTRKGRIVAIGAGIAWAVAVAAFDIQAANEAIYFVLSVICVVGVLIAVQKVGNGPLSRSVQWVGRHSIIFYVVHVMVMLVVSFRLIDMEVYNPWLMAGVGFTAAVTVSIALVRVRDIVPFSWLFAMPVPSRAGWARVREAIRGSSADASDRSVDRSQPRDGADEVK